MQKIDLGCGNSKQDGFIGVDRFDIPGVDVLADFAVSLPFDADLVDLVYASHSLEHSRDLMATMREVYRICKHGAQICIVAPYHEQKLNLANPYHVCAFNEHTPRFWTDYPDASIDPEEYAHPHAPHWGLSRSDHSNPGLDLRLVRMEFFYFPEYLDLSIEEQRALRRTRLDVCDQIMYHLIVWKGDDHSSERTFADHVAGFEPFEPNYVKERKTLEREELLQTISSGHALARSQFDKLREESTLLKEENLELRSRLESVELIKAKHSLLKAELEATNGLLEWYQAKEVSWNAESSRMEEELAAALLLRNQWEEGKRKVGDLYAQVTAYRSSRTARLASLFSCRDALWQSVSAAFYEIRSYTARHFRRSSRARLILGDDLGAMPYREYAIPYKIDSLNKVSLAICPLLPSSHGVVGIEIVSSVQQVVAQVSLPLKDIHADTPTDFIMRTPLVELGEPWSLRVFVKNAEVPVAVYELMKYSTYSRRINYLPFVSIQ